MSLFVLMSHALLHCLWYLLSIALRPQGEVPVNIQCSWLQPRLLFRDSAVSWKGNSNEVTEMDFIYLCLKLSSSAVGEGVIQFYSLASLSLWKSLKASKTSDSWAVFCVYVPAAIRRWGAGHSHSTAGFASFFWVSQGRAQVVGFCSHGVVPAKLSL